MGWTIILEKENKEIISSLNEEFVFESINSTPGMKLLKYLDPYGDTTFNHLQMDDLIYDLILLKTTDNSNTLIDRIISLAQKCKNQSHTYLTFYGD